MDTNSALTATALHSMSFGMFTYINVQLLQDLQQDEVYTCLTLIYYIQWFHHCGEVAHEPLAKS